MRLAVYGAASTVVAVGVVLSAFNQRANFYSACVYLAQSNGCLMVLTNILILLSIVFGHALQLLFYGPLRAMEVEQIYEKAWYAVTETCLAMTIFRDEFDVRFIIMFGVLLFVKCFSWIGSGRVEFMEQQPPDRPVLFHIRLAGSLLLLCATCLGMVWHSITAVLERGKPNMMVMFAFEFAILLITSTGILSRYIISLVEKYILYREAVRRKEARSIERAAARQQRQTQREENERRRAAGEEVEPVEEEDGDEEEGDEELDVGGWEEKGTWVFYSELCTDFLKLLTYLSFFSIVLTWYGLPLHIIRDVYLTLRSFITRIRDFIRYRRATAHMNSRYPDATVEEVGAEGVCIICREEMRPWTEGAPGPGGRAAGTQDQRHRPKKLPCGHVLHFACLRSWLERQQRCPTCRRPVLEENSAADANARNPAAGAPNGLVPQGNGLAFQAQWGFGGLQFGMGAGAMGDLIDRMGQNQVNQPQQQPAGPQPQVPLAAQFPQPPAPQQAPQAPAIPQAQTDIPARTIVQQRIDHTMQLIQREVAMLQQSQRELQELQQLQAQQNESNVSNPPAPPGPAAQATAGPGTGLANEQSAPGIANPPPLPFPGATPMFSPPLPAASTSGFPQGLTLPAGWSVIPLTVFGAGGLDTSARTPSLGNVTVLARRRGQRIYQENLRNYHALRTPTTERSSHGVELRGRSSRPSVDRTASAPATSSSSRIIRLADTSRLTPEQLSVLKPIEAECVTALSLFLARYYNEGRTEHVSMILLGLPKEIRKEILKGWPNPQHVQIIRYTIATMEQLYSGGDIITTARETAVRETVTMLLELERIERLRVLLALPTAFRNSVMDRTEESDLLRLEVERIRETLSNPEPLIPNMPEIPSLANDASPTEVSRMDAETREAIAQRIDVLNDAARRMREAAQSLEATANNSPFSVPTPNSFGANGGDRFSLFGERSVFPLPAQERTLRSLESDLVESEREFKARGVVEGLLNGGQNLQTEELETKAEASSPSAAEKGKGVDRSSD